MLLVSTTLAVALTALVVRFLHRRDPPPVFGVYRRPGKWFLLKYYVFQAIFRYRQWQNRRAKTDATGVKKAGAGYGINTHSHVDLMDQAQPLSKDYNAFDAVFFIGSSQDGHALIIGTERRQRGIINGLVYLLVPGKGLLCSKKLPDTVLFGAKEGVFGAEGILLEPVVPMRRWRLKFEGDMYLQSDPKVKLRVKIEAEWRSKMPVFNYDTDLHPSTVSTSIAKEAWTREYFKSLEEAHQTHYEQMGHLTGFAEIVGTEKTDILALDMQAFRDHSYGKKRDWDLMHRYAFHMFFLEDGTAASIGVISQPCTCSSLTAGFINTPDGQVHPVEWCDLELFRHGEGGTPPTDHMFAFKAGGKEYTVQVLVDAQNTHFVGWRWEARMVERFAAYVVNGVSGRGVTEFHYHNALGRSVEAAEGDPEWFAELVEQTREKAAHSS